MITINYTVLDEVLGLGNTVMNHGTLPQDFSSRHTMLSPSSEWLGTQANVQLLRQDHQATPESTGVQGRVPVSEGNNSTRQEASADTHGRLNEDDRENGKVTA